MDYDDNAKSNTLTCNLDLKKKTQDTRTVVYNRAAAGPKGKGNSGQEPGYVRTRVPDIENQNQAIIGSKHQGVKNKGN